VTSRTFEDRNAYGTQSCSNFTIWPFFTVMMNGNEEKLKPLGAPSLGLEARTVRSSSGVIQ